MRKPTVESLARRVLDAIAAAARGLAQAVESTLPAPQPVPVRVRRDQRR